MEQTTQSEHSFCDQKDNLDKLKADNALLRKQGKDARKKIRELERQMQVLEGSRWNRLGNCLRRIRSKLFWLCKQPIKIVGKIFHALLPANKTVNSSVNNIVTTESLGVSERHLDEELRFPVIDKTDNINFSKINGKISTISVVVCIHNALYDVAECLVALWEKRSFPYDIILIDDGSDIETEHYVTKFAEMTGVTLIRNEQALGYTISANIGLRTSQSDYVILLNSDTIVTEGWVEKMLACYRENIKTGIVSPLSNAASYQSVPEIYDKETGDWKINTLPDKITLEMMSQVVEMTSIHSYPKVPVLNGFCFMISRQVLNTIGYLDEENFPMGYGEEVDYCLRARKAGFELRVIDNTYIFHEKSKSFTHKTRKELGKTSKVILLKKHGEYYHNLDAIMQECGELVQIRERIKYKINDILDMKIFDKKIAFLLTTRGGNGGANSVCQEVMGMRKLGVNVSIINSNNYKEEFEKNYPELVPNIKYFSKKSEKSLLNISAEFDIIIGTIFTTIKYLKTINEKQNGKKFGYYIQDYEPLFFDKTETYWEEARKSYTLLDNICMFAKTKWICDTVEREHCRKIQLVEPSIDTAIYNPYVIEQKEIYAPVKITAMVRPKTERRNPIGTMRVLKLLKEKYSSAVEIHIFGCEDKDISDLGEVVNFEFNNHGILRRWEVASLLAESHVFLDMSTYQAFGRTGLESMSLACIAVVPEEGGTNKYALNNVNALVVDTSDEMAVYTKICDLIDTPEEMLRLQRNGMDTAQNYNIMKASMSELVVLNQYCC